MSGGFICGTPADQWEVIKTEVEPERWCFAERKRRTGVWTCKRPRLEWLMETEAWGWAEPVWTYRCDGCGGDRRAFGTGW
jgi:hypothetical protein